jgi:hypothetical protein
MSTKAIVRYQRADSLPATNRRIEDFTKQVSDCPLVSGRLIENIVIQATAPVTINHGLGRQPRGWIVTDQTDATNPTLFLERTSWDDKTLVLYSDMAGARTISIWVF